MKRLLLLLFLGIFLFPTLAFAWSVHGEMTKIVLDTLPWLNKYRNIEITQYSYQDGSPYNPNYKIPYLEGKIGDNTDAKTILSTYADEPDWGMDEGLSLNSMQSLTGGSHGWRHQYYILLGGILKLGEAPDRALHFYNMAVKAFKNNDPYWGFRFLARALHYLQDLTNPFHSNPGPTMILLSNIWDINGVTVLAMNHHFALEDYQEYQIKKKNQLYFRALRSSNPIKINNPLDAAVDLANRSKDYTEALWNLQSRIYGDKINQKSPFKIDPGKIPSGELKNDYDKIIIGALMDFSGITKGFLEYAKGIIKGSN